MTRQFLRATTIAALVLPLGAGGVLSQTPPADLAPQGSAGAAPSDLESRHVRTTILRGNPPVRPTPQHPVNVLPNGDISLNFPGVDVQAVATAVFGDILHAPFTIDPNVHTPVTVVTPHPVRKADLLTVVEQSLTNAGLVVSDRGGSYAILPFNAARGQAPAVGPDDPGYGNETIALKFVNAEEMRKLLDPLVPNAISVTDPTHNVLVISGDSTQRRALRELVAQFDVDWLKGMSFALLVPERTDARLIVPELEKLLNAPGSQSAGLVRLISMERLNGILAITSQPQYLDDVRRFVEVLDREGEGAERRVFVYKVQNSRASDLAKVLNAAFGNAGSGVANTDTSATDLQDRTNNGAALPGAGANPVSFAPPGQPGGLVGPTGFRQGAVGGAAGAAAAGGPASSQGIGGSGGATTIIADEGNNAIVVFATPRNYALVQDALRKLDVPPLQVMIDASISEVTLNHNLQYGIQWAFQTGRLSGALSQGTQTTQTVNTGGGTTTVNGVTTTTPSNTSTVTVNPGPLQNFPGLSFLYQGNGVSATLNALRTVTDVTVLSAPKLVVLNNHTATIQVGDQVPVSTGSATSTLTSGAPIVNSVDYRDTGIILKVTPRVNSGGLVLLDIAQEVSDVSTTTSSSISSPTIQQRKISTSVAVQDGDTIALGGLISNQVTKGRSTIPLLGNIPILGHVFGDTTGGLRRTELVVLLTPRVVRTPVDAEEITREMKEKMRQASAIIRRTPPLTPPAISSAGPLAPATVRTDAPPTH